MDGSTKCLTDLGVSFYWQSILVSFNHNHACLLTPTVFYQALFRPGFNKRPECYDHKWTALSICVHIEMCHHMRIKWSLVIKFHFLVLYAIKQSQGGTQRRFTVSERQLIVGEQCKSPNHPSIPQWIKFWSSCGGCKHGCIILPGYSLFGGPPFIPIKAA